MKPAWPTSEANCCGSRGGSERGGELALTCLITAATLLLTGWRCVAQQQAPRHSPFTYHRNVEIVIDQESWQHYQNLLGERHPVRTALACSGDPVTLACPAESALSVRGAHYGQNNDRANLCNRILQTASGGGYDNRTCALPDALQLVFALCDGQRSCRLSAASLTGADHLCSGLHPFLMVKFTCLPIVRTQLLCSGSYLLVSCEDSDSLTILHARLTNKFVFRNATCPDTVKADSGFSACPDKDMTNPVKSLCRRSDRSCSVKATFPPDRGCAHAHMLLVFACVPSGLRPAEQPPPFYQETEADEEDKPGGQLQKQQQPHQQRRNQNLVVNDQDRPAGGVKTGSPAGSSGDDRPTNQNEAANQPPKADSGERQDDLLVVGLCGGLVAVLLAGVATLLVVSRRIRRRRSRASNRRKEERQHLPAGIDSGGSRSSFTQLGGGGGADGINCYLLPRPFANSADDPAAVATPLRRPLPLPPPPTTPTVPKASVNRRRGTRGSRHATSTQSLVIERRTSGCSPEGSLHSEPPIGYAAAAPAPVTVAPLSSSHGTVRFSQFSNLYVYQPGPATTAAADSMSPACGAGAKAETLDRASPINLRWASPVQSRRTLLRSGGDAGGSASGRSAIMRMSPILDDNLWEEQPNCAPRGVSYV